jgi:hypothetical protein
MDTLNSLLTSGHKDLADSYNRIVTAASKMPKDHEIPGTNLFIRGFGRDVNGNKLVYVSIMDGRRSSIQTGGSEDMREVNRQYDMSIFSSDDKKAIKNIEEEVLDYVKKYGDPSIKSRLHIYKDKDKDKTPLYYSDTLKKSVTIPESEAKVTAANDDTLFVLTYISCDRTEDDFEKGEIGKTEVVMDEKCGKEFKTFNELIKYVSTNYGISDDKKAWYIYEDEIRVSYQVNKDNDEPSSSEIASWKLGKVKLYSADAYVRILFAKKPEGDELSKITGLRIEA